MFQLRDLVAIKPHQLPGFKNILQSFVFVLFLFLTGYVNGITEIIEKAADATDHTVLWGGTILTAHVALAVTHVPG